MSRAKRVVHLPPAVVMAKLHGILGQPPYRTVEAARGVFRFRVGDYDGARLRTPMEGILRVFGRGSVSEIDSDIQRIGRPPLLLSLLAVVLIWTIVVPLLVRWWLRRAPARVLDGIVAKI